MKVCAEKYVNVSFFGLGIYVLQTQINCIIVCTVHLFESVHYKKYNLQYTLLVLKTRNLGLHTQTAPTIFVHSSNGKNGWNKKTP